MHRQELVDVRQHGADTGWPGLEALVAQEWVEPDQPAAGLMESIHFLRESVADVAVEAIADEQHDRALSEQPTGPAAVDLREARADARAAGPVRDGRADTRNGDVDVALAQVARDVGQSRPEQEHVHAMRSFVIACRKKQHASSDPSSRRYRTVRRAAAAGDAACATPEVRLRRARTPSRAGWRAGRPSCPDPRPRWSG